MVLRICAWCERPIGLASKIRALYKTPERVSHGICWTCKEEQINRLEANNHDFKNGSHIMGANVKKIA